MARKPRSEWTPEQLALEKIRRARYRRNNPHKVREWRRRHTVKHKGNLRHVRRYGLTEKQYEQMLEQQGGVCAICRRKEARTLRGTLCALSVDHDHQTGAVRGLLCYACNTSLGGFRDSPALLERAAEYLKEGSNAQS